MATLTKQQQYRTVSAGFALGLLMNGYNQISSDKPKTELNFSAAWREWSHRNVLPSADQTISGARKDRDLIGIITELDKDKRQPYVPFHWDAHALGGATVVIREAMDFDPADDDDANFFARNISDKIPASAWQQLARNFIEKYT